VIQANSRPIVKLPNRAKVAGIPQGWTALIINGRRHFANFAKEFVNVIRVERDSEVNVLGDTLRGWFGSDVGLPGTRFEVEFTLEGDQLHMAPVKGEAVRNGESGA
jgi:hypothetical protein